MEVHEETTELQKVIASSLQQN